MFTDDCYPCTQVLIINGSVDFEKKYFKQMTLENIYFNGGTSPRSLLHPMQAIGRK